MFFLSSSLPLASANIEVIFSMNIIHPTLWKKNEHIQKYEIVIFEMYKNTKPVCSIEWTCTFPENNFECTSTRTSDFTWHLMVLFLDAIEKKKKVHSCKLTFVGWNPLFGFSYIYFCRNYGFVRFFFLFLCRLHLEFRYEEGNHIEWNTALVLYVWIHVLLSHPVSMGSHILWAQTKWMLYACS